MYETKYLVSESKAKRFFAIAATAVTAAVVVVVVVFHANIYLCDRLGSIS